MAISLSEFKRLRREKKILKTGEAAAIVDRSPDTVRRWINEGKVTGFRFGGTFYIYRESLEKYLNQCLDELYK